MIHKKIAIIAIIALLALSACSEDGKNVEITFPASFLPGGADQAIEEAKTKGVTDAKINEDGTVTYIMTKDIHDKMMKDIKDEFVQSIEDMLNSGRFPTIKDVEYNDKFTVFTLIVDREAYERSYDEFVMMGFVMQATYYQTFLGVAPEKIKVKIHVKDNATGEIFRTVTYPVTRRQN